MTTFLKIYLFFLTFILAVGIGRGFLLGVGRVIGVAIIFLFLAFSQSPKMALVLIGFICLLFPLTLYLKKIYRKGLFITVVAELLLQVRVAGATCLLSTHLWINIRGFLLC